MQMKRKRDEKEAVKLKAGEIENICSSKFIKLNELQF